MREAIYHVAELEAGKLKGEIEIDDAYFGGRRKGKRGRGARDKSILLALKDFGVLLNIFCITTLVL
ncbi:MAG: hypothetical protein GTN53_29560 [Candidatus Aminicenantes bacterium]|nr:hypothetical protein [Candidatus Aminicenantes bacterium]